MITNLGKDVVNPIFTNDINNEMSTTQNKDDRGRGKQAQHYVLNPNNKSHGSIFETKTINIVGFCNNFSCAQLPEVTINATKIRSTSCRRNNFCYIIKIVCNEKTHTAHCTQLHLFDFHEMQSK